MTDNDRQLKKETEIPLVIGLDAHSEKLVFSFFRKGADEASHVCLRRRTVHIADLETFVSKHIRPQDVTALEAFKTKMLKLATILGRDHVKQAGFKNASAFIDALTEKVFGPRPVQLIGTELQTVSASGV